MVAPLRTRRAAFWYLGRDRIVAAVVSRTSREPVLEACAASYSAPVAGARFAPGVLEVAWVLGCERFAHVAALAADFCRVEEAGQARETGGTPPPAAVRRQRFLRRSEAEAPAAAAAAGGERRGAVSGGAALRVWADEGAVAQAAGLFRRARLNLVALDCEPCALASLSEALGTADVGGARRQHLSAVAVLPESEDAAEALGGDLAVPVGLAVAWFGASRAL